MKITIKELNLVNFKGIKKLSISFDELITNIFGDNATGKTTVFDAFTWLFFGKESTDRKDFNIKNTVDKSLNRQDHEVNAIIVADGSEIQIRRIFKEKWTKRRGSSEATFTGNETEYFWDEIPVNGGEFNKRIKGIIDEGVFKLISNPSYFNSLHWKDRRNILFEMAGEISDQDIAEGNKKFEKLLSDLNGKSLEEFKKIVYAKKKPIKETLEAIPTRIDEVLSNIPDMGDASLIRRSISDLELKRDGIDQLISDRSKAVKKAQDEAIEHQNKVFEVQQKADKIKRDLKAKIDNAKSDIASNRYKIERELSEQNEAIIQIEKQRDRRQDQIADLKKQIVQKRSEWNTINARREEESKREIVFDEHAFTCPTCKRLFETEDVEEMKEKMQYNFDEDKAKKLQSFAIQLTQITEAGKKLSEEVARIESLDTADQIVEIQNKINELESKLRDFDNEQEVFTDTLEDLLSKDKEYKATIAELDNLIAIKVESIEVNVEDLNKQKKEVQAEIDSLKTELAKEDVIKANKIRVSELEEEEKRLAAELSELEGIEFTIEAFTRKKVEEVEKRINGMFKYVKFKMFNIQVNGAMDETCETMLDGVPYSDLNNAARINAGLDIINALSNHYKVKAPIFIDNAESITKLIEVQSQIIRLVVSENDKKLRVA